ncbi:ribose-phosphate diphosphokinase [Candidatus Dojkabacteria bacterium]|nr:ribose-phosphate diphosphokinase [Candidatus Dojkabacteria bacterium]
MTSNKIILPGSSNPELAKSISETTEIPLVQVEIENFPNKETRLRILEDLTNKEVIIVQSTGGKVDSYIVELLLLADAAKRRGAKIVKAVLPWLGYSPQDKVFREGEPLSSEATIKALETAPIDEFVLIDLHSTIVEKMFSKPMTHLSAMPIFVEHFREKLNKNEWVSVALDKGARERAHLFSQELDIPLVQFDKIRNKKTGDVTFINLEGDVNGKNVISFDDFAATGGTRIKASSILKEQGATKYVDCVTHLLVPDTTTKFEKSDIDGIYITNTIHLDKKYHTSKLKILDIGGLISRNI